MFKVNNKDTRTLIVNFENISQLALIVIAGWVAIQLKHLEHLTPFQEFINTHKIFAIQLIQLYPYIFANRCAIVSPLSKPYYFPNANK